LRRQKYPGSKSPVPAATIYKSNQGLHPSDTVLDFCEILRQFRSPMGCGISGKNNAKKRPKGGASPDGRLARVILSGGISQRVAK
jgi:hypothetical protein